jgi:glutathione S-transferase
MKLYGSPLSPFVRKVRIVLAEKKIECETEWVDVMAPDTPINQRNPLGKVPALMLDDETALFDSRVIVEFLDNVSPFSRLIPEENRERIAVRRWEALADGVIDAGILIRYESLRVKKEQSDAWVERQKGKVERGLAAMSAELGERPWCHGNGYTLADIAFGCCLGWLDFRKPAGIEWRGKYPNLVKHFDKLMERPSFQDTVPR